MGGAKVAVVGEVAGAGRGREEGGRPEGGGGGLGGGWERDAAVERVLEVFVPRARDGGYGEDWVRPEGGGWGEGAGDEDVRVVGPGGYLRGRGRGEERKEVEVPVVVASDREGSNNAAVTVVEARAQV